MIRRWGHATGLPDSRSVGSMVDLPLHQACEAAALPCRLAIPSARDGVTAAALRGRDRPGMMSEKRAGLPRLSVPSHQGAPFVRETVAQELEAGVRSPGGISISRLRIFPWAPLGRSAANHTRRGYL